MIRLTFIITHEHEFTINSASPTKNNYLSSFYLSIHIVLLQNQIQSISTSFFSLCKAIHYGRDCTVARTFVSKPSLH